MPRFLLFFLYIIISSILFTGCMGTDIPNHTNGFEVIHNTNILEQEIIDWIELNKHNAGSYKNHFKSGNYLMIDLGNHEKYIIKDVNIIKAGPGYLLNITVEESSIENMLFSPSFSSPIILKTQFADIEYQIKIIYQ